MSLWVLLVGCSGTSIPVEPLTAGLVPPVELADVDGTVRVEGTGVVADGEAIDVCVRSVPALTTGDYACELEALAAVGGQVSEADVWSALAVLGKVPERGKSVVVAHRVGDEPAMSLRAGFALRDPEATDGLVTEYVSLMSDGRAVLFVSTTTPSLH